MTGGEFDWGGTPVNGNAGVLRRAQGGQKPPVEQKGKSSLDLDFQYEYRTVKARPHDPSDVLGFKQEVSEKLPQDNWLVAAKRS